MMKWNEILLVGKKTLLSLFILQGMLMSAEIKHITIKDIKVPVVFEQDNNLPTFNLQLIFKNSGYIQDKKLPGLASMSSKLLSEGTKKLGSVQFAQKLEEKAIALSASNGFETFVVELSSLKDVRKDGIKLLKELLSDPNYSKETLNKLKTLKIGALKRKENDFDYVSRNELKKLVFDKTPLMHSASGSIESIEKIKLKDIQSFIEKQLVLQNLIIVAGGDITFEELSKEILKLLNSFKVGKAQKELVFEANDKQNTQILNKETQQAYIYFASPFDIHVNDSNAYIAKVASFILGGSGFGSRLMEEIRVKRGLAYSAYGYISVNKSHSYFTGYLQTKNDNSKEAQELVSAIVSDFVKKGVTLEELDAAKNFLTGSEPLRVETLSQRLNRSFTHFYRGLKQTHAQDELEKIDQLTLEDLNNYIQSHKEITKLSFSVVRN